MLFVTIGYLIRQAIFILCLIKDHAFSRLGRGISQWCIGLPQCPQAPIQLAQLFEGFGT